MKKFMFPLDPVLRYRDQILDNLKSEYAACMDAMKKKEEEIHRIREEYTLTQKKIGAMKEEPMIDLIRVRNTERYLDCLQAKTNRLKKQLEDLRTKAEKKKDEMVEARKDKLSIEKLKTKKIELHEKALQKEQEQVIEEFVVHQKVAAANRG